MLIQEAEKAIGVSKLNAQAQQSLKAVKLDLQDGNLRLESSCGQYPM